ncbi:GNAT family N-acetyltransferase [Pasteurellaceae bacterium HPA106]|uniref:GNAT family N-acetyltransferase n=1 Tax=Spirabiliibacterium pneumoniae TaxID=221400 RepID=UPI001AAD535A|nr:GNAT family N-acyltransferase [Spirabiliibacterium pneumoniae]MBE2895367.1 GNAT family N-acetyltransferase [Spirabiliibacterium pneumoniae]
MLEHDLTSEKHEHAIVVRLANTQSEIEQAQRLRYTVFAQEMGAKVHSVDGRDVDQYDAFCQHLIAVDERTDDVVGCYRLLTARGANALGQWYSQTEFDLRNIEPLLPDTVELGRACVHKDYRTGAVMLMLWSGLVKFMQENQLKYMIGCGSMSMHNGGDVVASLYRKLAKNYLCPEKWRVFPRNPIDLSQFDSHLAVSTPPLIKGYVRAGAYICGEPTFDPDFNTADVLILMTIDRLDDRYFKHLSRA